MKVQKITDRVFEGYEKPEQTISATADRLNDFHTVGIQIGFGDKHKLYKPFVVIHLIFWRIQFGYLY